MKRRIIRLIKELLMLPIRLLISMTRQFIVFPLAIAEIIKRIICEVKRNNRITRYKKTKKGNDSL